MKAELTVNRLQNAYFGPVSLALNGGEIVCLMGPSGSGKSSLLRAIADLDPATGDCRFNGGKREDMPAQNWRQNIAYVPAVPAWWAHLVRDHFSGTQELIPLMDQLGLDQSLLDQAARDLSTGEAIRFGLLRAVSHNPAIYLLDEPTASLDETSRDLVHALFKREVARGCAILWITHHRQEADGIADKLIKMTADGVIEEANS